MENLTPVNEDQSIPSIFEYAYNSLKILSFALSELKIFNDINDTSRKHFANSHILRNYHFTLMYTFVLEYCKLTEPLCKDKRLKDNERLKKQILTTNYAGLEKLNYIVYEDKGEPYKAKYQSINEAIYSILDSEQCKNIRKLRNEKIAHIDKESDFTPDMYYFTASDFNDLWTHYQSIHLILYECANEYEDKNKKPQPKHPFFGYQSTSIAQSVPLDYSKTLDEIHKYADYEDFYNLHHKNEQ